MELTFPFMFEALCVLSLVMPSMVYGAFSNGTCFTYLVAAGTSCSAIAASNNITISQIEAYNNQTWGWNGCDQLFSDNWICLSSGFPPMPNSIAGYICGPQVPGTPVAPAGTNLSTINMCPLNACCDIWGQCGTTPEFCVSSESSTGAPGTAAPGQNGCISNCGTDIAINATVPATNFAIGYFDSSGHSRPCLNASVDKLDLTYYTHVHFAFLTLRKNLSINTDDFTSQLLVLQSLSGIKRIISIGGWDFSTNVSTYNIFRDAMSTPTNIDLLVENVLAFLKDWDFDGLDWDWEYPSELDIPGIPSGNAGDATGYLTFLTKLKLSMPIGKTVCITAPASYWYLQHFPIVAMAEVVDYVVYMTYDFHGQWDYNNTFSDSGCPGGGCLRSHVNFTETSYALAMITKAGVPSNKVAVGVTSYARSFAMSLPGCWTPECTFTGPTSAAIAGVCTNTAGYLSDYELGLIMANDPTAQQLWDQDSYSNILTYLNATQWASYMNDSNKAQRALTYQTLNFLGTADWAVDLQSNVSDGLNTGSGVVYVDYTIYSEPSPVIQCTPPCTFVLPPMLLSTPVTISFAPVSTAVTLGETELTAVSATPATISQMSFFSVVISADANSFSFVATSSLQPSPVIISSGPDSTTIDLPPVMGPWPELGLPDFGAITLTFNFGAPQPLCTAECGTLCTTSCELTSSSSSTTSTSTTSCGTSVPTATGLCANGNFPVWDVETKTINCGISVQDLNELGGESYLSSCQQGADEDATDSIDAILDGQECCSNEGFAARRLLRSHRSSGTPRRAKQCVALPAIPYFVANPPPPGACHSTFLCDGAKWPNVCANARSAITSRSRTSILTYPTVSMLDFHDTDLWPIAKPKWVARVIPTSDGAPHATPRPGWGLIGCDVEEYPFGSGNTRRDKSPVDVMGDYIANARTVNRLVPSIENRAHGEALRAFYKQAGVSVAVRLGVSTDQYHGSKAGAYARGLVYCVAFVNTPTTNDDAGYLLDSTGSNICAQPYGNEFILVARAYTTSNRAQPGWTRWDPWFSVPNTGRLQRRIIKRTARSPDILDDTPPEWCESPSPGVKKYDPTSQSWALEVDGIVYGYPSPRNDPGRGGSNLKCVDVPAEDSMQSRSIALPDPESSTSLIISSYLNRLRVAIKDLCYNTKDHAAPSAGAVHTTATTRDPTATNIAATTVKDHMLQRRQGTLGVSGSGSFTDPLAYQYFLCPNDDYDPCASGDTSCVVNQGYPPPLDPITDTTTYAGPSEGLVTGGNPSSIPSSGASGSSDTGGAGITMTSASQTSISQAASSLQVSTTLLLSVPAASTVSPQPTASIVGPLNCFPASDSHCTIPDVQPNVVQSAVLSFCSGVAVEAGMVNETSANVTGGVSQGGLTYLINVGWKPDCIMVPMSITKPFGDTTNPFDPSFVETSECVAILQSCFSDCTSNNGHGGFRDVLCLRYGFYPEVWGLFTVPGPSDYFIHNSPCPAGDF